MKSILLLASMLLLVGTIGAQDEAKKDKKDKKKDEVEEMQTEVEEKQPAKPKVVAFQEPDFALDIEQANKANSEGIYNAYSMELLSADKKIVDKAWKSLMKSYKGKTKFNKREGEFATTSARITELGSAAFKVKASIEQRGDNVIVHSWYEDGDGYIDANMESEDAGINQMLDRFAVEVRQMMVKKEVDTEEKTLKQSESHLSKLKRQNDGYLKDIETAKRKIAEAEQKIIENEAEQEITIDKIDGQRMIVEAVRQRLKRIN